MLHNEHKSTYISDVANYYIVNISCHYIIYSLKHMHQGFTFVDPIVRNVTVQTKLKIDTRQERL